MRNRNMFNAVVTSVALVFSMGAYAQALYVTPLGNVGIGTDSPGNVALEVRRSNGKAKVLISEYGPPGQRALFHIKNPGTTHFKIENTVAETEWVFTNAGTSFYISQQGTGRAEFRIFNTGDAILAGVLTENSDVNSKQDIEPIDGTNILEKLRNLEISEWSYKDTPANRHIGPMAQDFYAAFGLGNTNKGIATLDTSGVALAAIRALINENTTLSEQNASQSEQIETLERRLKLLENQQAEMQAVMAKVLENQQAKSVLTSTVMN
jgi:hypothetical protein